MQDEKFGNDEEIFVFKSYPKVVPKSAIFGNIGFSKGSAIQNHLYHNENLFTSIDIRRVSFTTNYF